MTMSEPTRDDLRYWTGEKFADGSDPIIALVSNEQFDRIAKEAGFVKVFDECTATLTEDDDGYLVCPDPTCVEGRVLREGVYRIWWCAICRMTEHKPFCSFGHTDGQWMIVSPAEWLEADDA